MLRRQIVLLIAIRPSDGDVKPGGPLGAFREEQAMSWNRVSPSLFLSSSSHTTQLNYTNRYTYSHPNLNFLQHYTDTLPTRNVVCPSGAWFENRPHSSPSIRLARNPKHVIVQWVEIRTDRQFNSYPLQCAPPSLSTHLCIHVLHCSKQCYSSSTPRPFSSCAGFTFTISTDGKWVLFSTLFTSVYRNKSQDAKSANMEDFQVFECVYWEESSRAKGRCEVGHCPDAASRRCSSRDSASSSARFVALSLC